MKHLDTNMSTPESLPHTKLPWKLHTLGGYSLLVSESGPLVAKLETVVQGFVVPIGDAIANARFILVACNNYDSLRTRLAEVQRELVGISAALDSEFGLQDKRSGDLLDDMGCFIEHHKAKEKELAQLKEANAELVKVLGELVEAATVEVNDKGAGGYLLARITDAKAALEGVKN